MSAMDRLDLVTAALQAMDIKQGCEVYLQCDAPARFRSGNLLYRHGKSLLTAPWRAGKAWTMDAYALADLAYQRGADWI